MNLPAKIYSGITVRKLNIAATPIGDDRWYLGGDPIATAFFNALTITFPQGENFFIDSVRPYRKLAPSGLAREIADFIKQEAMHSSEHAAFNDQIKRAGYDVDILNERVRHELGRFKARSPIRQLGLTIALEHFTALFARELLAKPHHLENTPYSVRRLWRWHALEEIEHKAVAFDTFLFATRDWSRLRRWAFRSFAMMEASYQFSKVIGLNMRNLYAQDRFRGWFMAARTLRYLFGPAGPLRAMAKGWLAWFFPGFHPWNQDDRALIAPVAAEFTGPID
ncbi:MAG: metal-dependent hydrolase [Sphingorhabdus sp.]